MRRLSDESRKRIRETSLLPTWAGLSATITVAVVTALFYTVSDRCSGDVVARAGICIASYMCCEPGRAVGAAGLSLAAALVAATARPLGEYLGSRLCVPDRALRPRAQSLALGAAGAFLVGAAASLLVFALFTKCAAFTIHTLAGNCFFACALCFCVFYNGWHLLAAADAPVALHASRVLLLGGLLASTVAEFVIGSHAFMSHYAMHGWFVNQWVVVSLLLAQLALVQIDFLREKLLGLTFADAGDAEYAGATPPATAASRPLAAAPPPADDGRAARGALDRAVEDDVAPREPERPPPPPAREPERAVDESAPLRVKPSRTRARPTPKRYASDLYP